MSLSKSLMQHDGLLFMKLKNLCRNSDDIEKFINLQNSYDGQILNRKDCGNTLLTIACNFNNYNVIKSILENNNYTDETINAVSEGKMNALLVLCSISKPTLPSVHLLFTSGRFSRPSINATSSNGMNALHYACSRGDVQVPTVEYLLSNNDFTPESINGVNELQQSALEFACCYVNFPAVKLLIESELFTEQTANGTNYRGLSALGQVCGGHWNEQIFDYLMSSPKIWNSTIVNTYNKLVENSRAPIPHTNEQINSYKREKINAVKNHERFINIMRNEPHLIDGIL